MPPSLRPTRQQLDDQIVDRAAALFARHGFAATSLQAVADAVGYSKAGLLHHFPSKEALHAAALSMSRAQATAVLDSVAHLPDGAERDRRSVEALADATLATPGLTALNLSQVLGLGTDRAPASDSDEGKVLFAIFGIDPAADDPDRLVRVISAIAGMSVVALVAAQVPDGATWRRSMVTAALDALGHRRPGATASRSDQVEA